MDHWQDRAVCKPPVAVSTFYEGIWANEWAQPDRPPQADPGGLREARGHCYRCPVRRECLVASLDAERGDGVAKRFGLNALTTPHQRVSIEKRGPWPVCSRCGQAADPAEYLAGAWTCCHTRHVVPPLPDIGDEWFRRHTQLSVQIIAWVRKNVAVGDPMPSPTQLAKTLKARNADVSRIYAALVEDGTVLDQGRERPRYLRVGRLGAVWSPPHLHA